MTAANTAPASTEARPDDAQPGRKYSKSDLLRGVRLFAKARQEARALGLIDNAGALHSVSRFLEIFAHREVYPWVTHTNNMKRDPRAERSAAAAKAIREGKPVLIEHVAPQAAFARAVCDLLPKARQMKNSGLSSGEPTGSSC